MRSALAFAGLSVLISCGPVELDDDGDGVENSTDQCPGTPEAHVVDAAGCSQDSDNDGVFNGPDSCPETSAGAVVDEEGCSNGQIGPSSNILCLEYEGPGLVFEHNGTEASPVDRPGGMPRYVFVEVTGGTTIDVFLRGLSQEEFAWSVTSMEGSQPAIPLNAVNDMDGRLTRVELESCPDFPTGCQLTVKVTHPTCGTRTKSAQYQFISG